jgi:hypothetical protein
MYEVRKGPKVLATFKDVDIALEWASEEPGTKVVCSCEATHVKGHAKCYEAEEHVCGPCECDCHYSQE